MWKFRECSTFSSDEGGKTVYSIWVTNCLEWDGKMVPTKFYFVEMAARTGSGCKQLGILSLHGSVTSRGDFSCSAV
jgi:hypothetical protein